MGNKILLSEIEKFASVYNFVVAGIETHLNNDETEPEMITDALISLQEQLQVIINNAKAQEA